jgi:hypothetical protein
MRQMDLVGWVLIHTLNLEMALRDVLIDPGGMGSRSCRLISSQQSNITNARMANASLIGTVIAQTDYEEHKSGVQQTN